MRTGLTIGQVVLAIIWLTVAFAVGRVACDVPAKAIEIEGSAGDATIPIKP